jgi:hypothetical protein
MLQASQAASVHRTIEFGLRKRGRFAPAFFWQRRFYDFKVWSLKKKVEKLHYMHMNPLKRNWSNIPRTGPGAAFHSTLIPNTG